MVAQDLQPFLFGQNASERTGLPESLRHRRVAGKKTRYLLWRKPVQDGLPFYEGRAHIPAIASRPAAQIPPRNVDQARIPSDFFGDQFVLGGIDTIDSFVREFLHALNIPKTHPFEKLLTGLYGCQQRFDVPDAVGPADS